MFFVVAVFDILLRYTETGSWKEAFFKVIPKRKQAQQSCSVERQHQEESAEDEQAETINSLETIDDACADDTKHKPSNDCTASDSGCNL